MKFYTIVGYDFDNDVPFVAAMLANSGTHAAKKAKANFNDAVICAVLDEPFCDARKKEKYQKLKDKLTKEGR